jgi:hypothetical protein
VKHCGANKIKNARQPVYLLFKEWAQEVQLSHSEDNGAVASEVRPLPQEEAVVAALAERCIRRSTKTYMSTYWDIFERSRCCLS